MFRVFPFGRGGRGSRQRVVVESKKWGGLMIVHEASVRVLRTHGPDITVVKVGTSTLDGKRTVFFTSQISEAFNSLKQAAKDFKTICRTNKIKVDKPKRNE